MSDNQELVSVVVPVHNVERFLLPCLKSISAQSHSNLEVFLVDDGSTDSSGKICDEFAVKDGRFHVIHTSCNGPGPARNVGLDASHGEWIAFVDSDDVLHPHYIKYLLEAAISTGTDLSACEYQGLLESESPQFHEVTIALRVISSEDAIQYMFSCRFSYAVVWAKLFRKSLLLGVRFKSMMVEDTEFLSRVFPLASKIAYFENKLYYYYRRERSLSHSSIYKSNMVFAYWGIVENYQKNYPEYTKMAALFCLHSVSWFRSQRKNESKMIRAMVDQIQKASWKIAFPYRGFTREKGIIWFKIHFPKSCKWLRKAYTSIRR